MPTPKKFPKKPKKSASIKTMQNYLDKVEAIKKFNADIVKAEAKAKAKKESDKKLRATLQKRISGI